MGMIAILAKMQVKGRRRLKSRTIWAIIIATAFLIGFEAYTLAIVHIEGKAGLPQNIGNFEQIRNSLKEQEAQEKFSFAVVGDTRSSRTFERLCDKLRNESLSFMVILGDFVETCTKGNHDYFKYECMKKYHLPFPVFLIAGNRDVVCKEKHYDIDKVSLADFEKMYGPSNFAFEYNGCLFVGLCILPYPFHTEESIKFLDSTLAEYRNEKRKVFVFTHVPPVMSTGPVKNPFKNVEQFIDVINRYKVDYVISAHYHGYDRTVRKDTVYLVTGGGGAPLDEKKTFGGFYHAAVLTVDNESVSEKTVLAHNEKSTANDLRHFAISEFAPFLIKHRALAVIGNLLVFSILCVSLGNLTGKRPYYAGRPAG